MNKRQIKEKLLKKGMISEYLPSEFVKDNFTNKQFQKAQATSAAPFLFSMSKFDKNNNRRIIAIPEVGSYLVALKQLLNDDILNNIIGHNKKNNHSLSKIIGSENIRSFVIDYGFQESYKQKNDFINNLKLKLEKTNGAKGILHLDIANFYGSFYTHNIASIINGAKWAQEQFEKSQKKITTDKFYNNLSLLDERIRGMNLKRTHGLLVGPTINYILAESILSTIDLELENELENENVEFLRYMDDYDVIITNRWQIEKVKKVFVNVLQDYGFVLNDAKTEYEEFPYYQYENYEPFTKTCIIENDIFKCYSYLSKIEKEEEQNGALFYLSNHMLDFRDEEEKNREILISIALDLLNNIPKAASSTSNSIIKLLNPKRKEDEFIVSRLSEFLSEAVNKQFDLEAIWILYTLLKSDPNYSMKNDELLKMNDLAIVMYMNEREIDSAFKTAIKAQLTNRSWVLKYEMLRQNFGTIEDLQMTEYSREFYNLLVADGYRIYKKKVTVKVNNEQDDDIINNLFK